MRQILLIAMVCLFAGIVHAQITTNEQPFGLREKMRRTKKFVKN